MTFLQKCTRFILLIAAIVTCVFLVEACQGYLEEAGILAKASSRVITKGDVVEIYSAPLNLWMIGGSLLIFLLGLSVFFTKGPTFIERLSGILLLIVATGFIISCVPVFQNPWVIINNQEIIYGNKQVAWDHVACAEMKVTSIHGPKRSRVSYNIVLYGKNNRHLIILRRVENLAMERTELLALIMSKIALKNIRVRIKSSIKALKSHFSEKSLIK